MKLVGAEEHVFMLVKREFIAPCHIVHAALIHISKLKRRVLLALEEKAALFLLIKDRVETLDSELGCDSEIRACGKISYVGTDGIF